MFTAELGSSGGCLGCYARLPVDVSTSGALGRGGTRASRLGGQPLDVEDAGGKV